MFSPPSPCVPTSLESHPTCDMEDQGSAEGRAPYPMVLIPLLVPTGVSPTASCRHVHWHGVDDHVLLSFHGVFQHAILAEDNAGSMYHLLKETISQDDISFLSSGSAQHQDWSLEGSWRDGTEIPTASLAEKLTALQCVENLTSRGGQ